MVDTSSSPSLYEAIALPLLILLLALLLAYWLWRRQAIVLRKPSRNDAVFPLLALPDELIGYIISFLPIKDRMRARLCKRIDNIEYNYKYYVSRLLIHERTTNSLRRFDNTYITDHEQYFVLLEEKVYSIMFFKRLIRSAMFGRLAINMSGRDNFHWELLILVKECNAEELVLRFDFFTIQDIVVDDYILDLMNTCTKLSLENSGKITAIGIHSIYTILMKRSSKMYSIEFGITPMVVLREFLLMAAIRFDNGNLFSDRNIEAYDFMEVVKDDEEDEDDDVYINKHVFDGNLEMRFGKDIDENDGNLKLTYHQSNEDLEKIKATKGFIRTVVNPL